MNAKLSPDAKKYDVSIQDSEWEELRKAALADDRAAVMRWVLKLKDVMDAAKTSGPYT